VSGGEASALWPVAASVVPQGPGSNPTGLVAAPTCRLEAIRERPLKAPGPMDGEGRRIPTIACLDAGDSALRERRVGSESAPGGRCRMTVRRHGRASRSRTAAGVCFEVAGTPGGPGMPRAPWGTGVPAVSYGSSYKGEGGLPTGGGAQPAYLVAKSLPFSMYDHSSDTDLRHLQLRHGGDLALRHLVEAGLDVLPLPGRGQTLARWRVLAEVAAHDLSLAKLFEGHTDALAIQAELGAVSPVPPVPAAPAGARWATWCAEPPDARVVAEDAQGEGGEGIRLSGTKAWCSGAAVVTHAIVSCWNQDGEPCLAVVAMDQPGVAVTDEGWHAVGMAATASVNVRFDGARAHRLGRPGDYTRRPGFWQGGAGIAACWFGGAWGIARRVHALMGRAPDAHRLAHLGAIDAALTPAAALLRETAAWIDRHPRDDAQRVALRARLAIERAATDVMDHAGRALGAGPLCRDPGFAQAMADLPVFLRQSHAERDLAALGTLAAQDHGEAPDPWKL